MKNISRREFMTTVGTAVLMTPIALNAATATLQWNPVTEAGGYKLYWGLSSRFVNGVSGTISTNPFYDGTATVTSGTYRIDTDPPNKIMQIITITEDTVIPSPLDVLDTQTVSIVLGIGHYYFAVTAYNDYGESEYSEEVNAEIVKPKPGAVEDMRVVHFNVPPAPGGEEYVNLELHITGLKEI